MIGYILLCCIIIIYINEINSIFMSSESTKSLNLSENPQIKLSFTSLHKNQTRNIFENTGG